MASALRSGGILPVAIGTAAWAVALAVTAAIGGASGNPWFWTCLVGTVSGLVGMRYLTVRWERRERPRHPRQG